MTPTQTPTTKETPMTAPAIDATLDPSHDCEKEYRDDCPDACADPCECGCNEEPESSYGVLCYDTKRDELRAATGREAARWAREMVKAGILPKDHPQVLHVRRLRRRELARFWARTLGAGLAGAAVGALLPSWPLTSTESGVLVIVVAGLYVVWLFSRSSK